MTGQSGSHAGAARLGRGYKDRLETYRFLPPGTSPTPPAPPTPDPPRPAPSRSPSAHALFPSGATWRFKSGRLARAGRRRGWGTSSHAPAPGDSRTPRPGRRAPPLLPGEGTPGAGEGVAPRGRAPRGGVFCAPRHSRGRWRAPGAPPVLPLGPCGARLSSAQGGLGRAGAPGPQAVPGRAASGRGAGPPGSSGPGGRQADRLLAPVAAPASEFSLESCIYFLPLSRLHRKGTG